MNSEYYAILGINPSKGARSPILWNRVFKKLKINSKMICIDIEPKLFNQKVNQLFKDKNFKGGAITNPYKEKIFKKLEKKNITKSANKCGALNLIVRNGSKFLGFNTDGEAALIFLKTKVRNLLNKKILILGFGGAGKAICSYLSVYCKKKVTVSTRLNKSCKLIKKKGFEYISWKSLSKNISRFDLIINSTNVGHRTKKTPIKKEVIKKCFNKVFFDIIYQPKKTSLLKIAHKNRNIVFNGLDMNFIQAAKSFSRATNFKNLNYIKKIMKK